jgi:hypothetical protein
LQATGRVVELALRFGNYDVLTSRVIEHTHRPLNLPVGNRDNTHAWRAVDDLVGKTLAHEAGTYDAYTDGLIVLLAGF